MYVVFYDYPDPDIMEYEDKAEAEAEYRARADNDKAPPVYLCEVINKCRECV